jgi:hypothetical protein
MRRGDCGSIDGASDARIDKKRLVLEQRGCGIEMLGCIVSSAVAQRFSELRVPTKLADRTRQGVRVVRRHDDAAARSPYLVRSFACR